MYKVLIVSNGCLMIPSSTHNGNRVVGRHIKSPDMIPGKLYVTSGDFMCLPTYIAAEDFYSVFDGKEFSTTTGMEALQVNPECPGLTTLWAIPYQLGLLLVDLYQTVMTSFATISMSSRWKHWMILCYLVTTIRKQVLAMWATGCKYVYSNGFVSFIIKCTVVYDKRLL